MRRAVVLALALFALAAPPVSAADTINPKADFKAFRDYFTKRFPKVPLNDFVNGPYSMDADLRKTVGGDRRLSALPIRAG